jgi:hypothetical protein
LWYTKTDFYSKNRHVEDRQNNFNRHIYRKVLKKASNDSTDGFLLDRRLLSIFAKEICHEYREERRAGLYHFSIVNSSTIQKFETKHKKSHIQHPPRSSFFNYQEMSLMMLGKKAEECVFRDMYINTYSQSCSSDSLTYK